MTHSFCWQIKLANAAKRADMVAQSKLKDRLRSMKQLVDGIKAIKFYAWEESYTEKVQ